MGTRLVPIPHAGVLIVFASAFALHFNFRDDRYPGGG